MTNKEKFKEKIWEIACDGSKLAMKDGDICKCTEVKCGECGFFNPQRATLFTPTLMDPCRNAIKNGVMQNMLSMKPIGARCQ